jgi:hypothetical protein
VFPDRLKAAIESALRPDFGPGPWVAAVVGPYVYLGAAARSRADAPALARAALEALRRVPHLMGAWTLHEIRGWSEDVDAMRRALAASIAPDQDADFAFLTEPYHALDIGRGDGAGTHHGSPHDYDRRVPVLAFGAHVPRLRRPEPVSQLGVAPTLAKLLGVPPPAQARHDPLF